MSDELKKHIYYKYQKDFIEYTILDSNLLSFLRELRFEFFNFIFKNKEKTNDFIRKIDEKKCPRGRNPLPVFYCKYSLLKYIKETYPEIYTKYGYYIIYVLLNVSSTKYGEYLINSGESNYDSSMNIKKKSKIKETDEDLDYRNVLFNNFYKNIIKELSSKLSSIEEKYKIKNTIKKQ